jgi:hypothetical protein
VRPAKLFGAGVLGLNEPIPPASAGGSLVLPFAFFLFAFFRCYAFLFSCRFCMKKILKILSKWNILKTFRENYFICINLKTYCL